MFLQPGGGPKREIFEAMESDAKSKTHGQVNENTFEYLVNLVRECASKRRLEAQFRKAKGDPMDVGDHVAHVQGVLGVQRHDPCGNYRCLLREACCLGQIVGCPRDCGCAGIVVPHR